jgi:hypothetical protein
MERIVRAFTLLIGATTESEPTARYRALSTSAEHDQIYCGGPDRDQLPQEILVELEELGFFWDEELESWSCFT